MNPARTIRRLARILASASAAALACAAAPAALATSRPPPGWNKHPPLPAHAHAIASAGMPGWQVTLIAVAALLAAALAVTGYRILAARRRVSATAA